MADVGSSCLLPQHQAWPTSRCQLLHMGFSCLSPAELWEARGQHLSGGTAGTRTSQAQGSCYMTGLNFADVQICTSLRLWNETVLLVFVEGNKILLFLAVSNIKCCK